VKTSGCRASRDRSQFAPSPLGEVPGDEHREPVGLSMRSARRGEPGGRRREARVAHLDHLEAGLAEGAHGGVDLVADARMSGRLS
jgi:hypothetical protein